MKALEDPIVDAFTLSNDRKAELAEILRHRILFMELAPSAVIDEVALSKEFGLSRPPVREILRHMAGEGYIKLEHNRAARVASLSLDSLRNFFLAAPILYITTTKLAADLATPRDIVRLKAIQHDFDTAIAQDDMRARVLANANFHQTIGEISKNEYLMPSLRRLLIDHSRIGRIYFQSQNSANGSENIKIASRHHHEMIEAIENHDATAAGEIVRHHLDLSRQNMTAYVVPDGLETEHIAS